jgi:hypothetical protein
MILVDLRDVLSLASAEQSCASPSALLDLLAQLGRAWRTRLGAVVEPSHRIGVPDGAARQGVRIYHARPRATPARIGELLLGPLAAQAVLVATSCPRAERIARSCGARVASSRALWLSLRRPTGAAAEAHP